MASQPPRHRQSRSSSSSQQGSRRKSSPPPKASAPDLRLHHAQARANSTRADPERVIPVVVVGLGFIGREIARCALAHPRLELVGVVDTDPKLQGKTLDELGLTGSGLQVLASAELLKQGVRGGAVLLATCSRVDDAVPQLESIFRLGASVVSTCEELAYPWLYHPEAAERIDRAAQKAGVCALGTGVNPGFVLDRLVAVAGSLSGNVQHVHAERRVDASTRREALQRKVGAGLSEEQFAKLAENDAIGHVGLAESCALAALGLGLDLDEVEEELLPVLADEDALGGAVPVKAGQVAGIYQQARGFTEGREIINLELTIAVGATPATDRIRIDAEPNIEIEAKGGWPGDTATAWAVVNAVPSVVQSEPGLLTVLDLPAGR